MYGRRLKQLRKERNLTVYEFAEKIGINGSTYHGYEKSRRKPPLDTVIDIAKYCEVSVDWILGLTDDRNVQILEKDIAEYIKHSDINFHGYPVDKEVLQPIYDLLEKIVINDQKRKSEKKMNKKEPMFHNS